MKVQVFGPAYLDRVLRVDRPLIEPPHEPLDLSVGGRLEPGAGLVLADPAGRRIAVRPPRGWPGPLGTVHLAQPLSADDPPPRREIIGVEWLDDLGGMGAGFAAALQGELTSALGSEDDPASRTVSRLLNDARVVHHPLRQPGQPADWTLLVTSGPHGDKLPIGFRGCHEAIETIPAAGTCELRVVASLPNRLAAQALAAPGAAVRMFAPAWRNVSDRVTPIDRMAGLFDVLCCNRREWEAIADPGPIRAAAALLAITDGARGCRILARDRGGNAREIVLPAFPRRHPPRDTNRAGEAFAATLIRTLLDRGWRPDRPCDVADYVDAGVRASAAAALVLDQERFGFPDEAAIEAALKANLVGDPLSPADPRRVLG